jgi:hypothetical protein
VIVVPQSESHYKIGWQRWDRYSPLAVVYTGLRITFLLLLCGKLRARIRNKN